MFCSAEKSEHLLAALRTIGLNEMGYWASWMTALFVPCTVSALLAVVRPTAAAVLLPNPTSRLPCSPLHPPVCLLPTPPSCLALLAAEPLRVTPAAHRLGARHPAVHQVPNLDPVLGHAALPAGESWLTAAIPMENPYCGCKLTRVRSCLQSYASFAAFISSFVKQRSRVNAASFSMFLLALIFMTATSTYVYSPSCRFSPHTALTQPSHSPHAALTHPELQEPSATVAAAAVTWEVRSTQKERLPQRRRNLHVLDVHEGAVRAAAVLPVRPGVHSHRRHRLQLRARCDRQLGEAPMIPDETCKSTHFCRFVAQLIADRWSIRMTCPLRRTALSSTPAEPRPNTKSVSAPANRTFIEFPGVFRLCDRKANISQAFVLSLPVSSDTAVDALWSMFGQIFFYAVLSWYIGQIAAPDEGGACVLGRVAALRSVAIPIVTC